MVESQKTEEMGRVQGRAFEKPVLFPRKMAKAQGFSLVFAFLMYAGCKEKFCDWSIITSFFPTSQTWMLFAVNTRRSSCQTSLSKIKLSRSRSNTHHLMTKDSMRPEQDPISVYLPMKWCCWQLFSKLQRRSQIFKTNQCNIKKITTLQSFIFPQRCCWSFLFLTFPYVGDFFFSKFFLKRSKLIERIKTSKQEPENHLGLGRTVLMGTKEGAGARGPSEKTITLAGSDVAWLLLMKSSPCWSHRKEMN